VRPIDRVAIDGSKLIPRDGNSDAMRGGGRAFDYETAADLDAP
jgi:hypothetical protein